MSKILLGRSEMVCTSQTTGKEDIMACDSMLLFGNTLPHSLLNTNQIRVFVIKMNDNLFYSMYFIIIDIEKPFSPLNTIVTVLYFNYHTPDNAELKQ